MFSLAHALIWASAMILIVLASQFGLLGNRLADILMYAAIGIWVATRARRGCGACVAGD